MKTLVPMLLFTCWLSFEVLFEIVSPREYDSLTLHVPKYVAVNLNANEKPKQAGEL